MKDSTCKKIIRDRLNTLKSERSQYTTEKMGKRIHPERVAEYDIRIVELEWLISKLNRS